jgi:thiol-disulfide isomerase/thioredoxin
MANLIEVATKLIRPYYYYIIAFVVIIIFVIVAYYGYNKFATQDKNKLKDVANANRRNKETVIYFFHVDWCPHCKKALPEWNKFTSAYEGKEINGYKLKCMDIDCTQETSDVTEFINKYKIDSYPTVKLLRDGNTIDFETKITNTSLEQFVNTMLN